MAKTFTRLGKQIAIAVKAGGPEPENNPALRSVIAVCKRENMPKDNIDRAIKNAMGKDQSDYKSMTYEGYGPHGVAIFVDTLTDNPTRTVADVRSVFNKFSGTLGTMGSLAFLFDHKAVFTFKKKEDLDMDEFILEMIDYDVDEDYDIDEEEGNSEIAEACWRSMSTRDDPLFITCTTQGFSRPGCWLDKKIAKAKRVIDGEDEDVRFLPFLFEQDSEAEIWQDEASWEKSNPSIRYGVKKIEILRRDVELAKTDKATRLHLLCKDFNVRQEAGAQTWLAANDFEYSQEAFDLEDFRGSYALFSVDLSATTDLTSVKVLLMKPAEKTKYVWSHYFIPESKLENADDKSAGAQYAEWARQGYLTIHEGNEVDVEAVADLIGNLYRDYKIKPFKVAYDQRFAKMFVRRCEDYYGFETEIILQGRALSSAMKLTEAELKSRNVNYGGNPIDKWCLSNCCAQVDNAGNIQPVKISGQAAKRIDGAVTLIMLFEIFRRYRSDFLAKIGG